MSSADKTATSGRGRAITLIALVVVIALVAAVATWVFSARTHAPTPRELSPLVQVAAGSEHVDTESGVVVRVPEGWRVEDEGELIFGTTALVPDESLLGEPDDAEAGPGSLVLIGAMGPELFAAQAGDTEQAATMLASGMGEFFLPVPGERTDVRQQELSGRNGDGWAVSYRVVPSDPGLIGPEGALVYAAVVTAGDDTDDDDGAFWLTYIGSPGDGSMASPDERWADRIVERFRPAD